MQQASIGPRPGLAKDGRQDLGYGRSDANFHFPRSYSNSFPYKDIGQDDHEQILTQEDEELVRDIVRITMSNPVPSDSLARISLDKTSLVGGNHPLGESPSGKSIVPFPKMYSKRIQAGGGANKPFLVRPGQPPRTGTTRGWSKAPPDASGDVKFADVEDGEPIELVKVRNMIRKIIAQESE